MGHCKGSPKGVIHRDSGLPKKDRNISDKEPIYSGFSSDHRNISNKQPIPTPTRIGRTTTKTAHSKQKKGNNQDQNRIK